MPDEGSHAIYKRWFSWYDSALYHWLCLEGLMKCHSSEVFCVVCLKGACFHTGPVFQDVAAAFQYQEAYHFLSVYTIQILPFLQANLKAAWLHIANPNHGRIILIKA